MKRIILVFMLFIGTGVFGQKVGIQFYQGLNIPKVFYSGAAGAISYQSNVNSDSRVGIYFGDLNKLSVATLIGGSTVKATAKNDHVLTSFEQSSIRVDIPIRYAIPPKDSTKDFIIKSLALVPSYGFLTNAFQTVNGVENMADDFFNRTNFNLGLEIGFTGFSSDLLEIQPYVSYRFMLSDADTDADVLRINHLSLGLRIDISK